MTSSFSSARDLADAFVHSARRVGETTPAVRGADWRTATVTDVGAGTVTADGIVCRCLETYALPTVGDLAAITQSSSGNWLAVGRTADGSAVGWVTPTLGTGYTQGNTSSAGNNNGPIRYRRVPWLGTWWMEWDGGANRANGAQNANILSAALASQFRPVARASMVIARNATSITGVANSTSVVHSLKIDFDSDGTVSLVSATAGDVETNWFSLKGIRYPLS